MTVLSKESGEEYEKKVSFMLPMKIGIWHSSLALTRHFFL